MIVLTFQTAFSLKSHVLLILKYLGSKADKGQSAVVLRQHVSGIRVTIIFVCDGILQARTLEWVAMSDSL